MGVFRSIGQELAGGAHVAADSLALKFLETRIELLRSFCVATQRDLAEVWLPTDVDSGLVATENLIRDDAVR